MNRGSRVRIVFNDAGEVEDYWLGGSEATAEQDVRGWQGMMLASSVEICRALLRGETVPLSQLDQDAVRRFGLRS